MPFKAPKTPSIWKNPWHMIACCFGVGKAPVAPGTFGTLFAVLVYFFLRNLSPLSYSIALVLVTILGMLACHITARDWQVMDPVAACFDEVVGFLFAMFLVPFSWVAVLIGFCLFRFFDILKPWPISWVDKHIHGGVGIVLDDVLAGIVSCILLHLIMGFLS